MVTYTDNKKLNKPANGEYPDTWDVPVNQDWDIIDKALGSAVQFAVGASDITLTISDAQNQRIVLTGTPGVSRYIIIPFKYLSATTAVGGMWIVDNQTNANQYVITEAPGSTGVTVATGRKALVYSDGTDVKFADETRLIAGTGISVSGSTVSLSTPVSVANGGTGLATLTSGNVILGNGTGNPTFVAPGTVGNVLTSNGSSWYSAAPTGGGGGGITSIGISSTTGLIFTPSPITTPGGTFTMSGTLSMGNGGTGVTTISAGLVRSTGSTLNGAATVNLSTEVSNTLGIGNGGTGITSLGTGVQTALGSAVSGANGAFLVANGPIVTSSQLFFGSSSNYIIYNSGAGSIGAAVGGTGVYSGDTTNFSVVRNLLVIGAGSVPYALQANFTIFSDARTKKDVTPYTKSTDAINTLSPVDFSYNGAYGTPNDNVTRTGLIAQDVLNSALPEIITTRPYKDPNTGQTTEVYQLDSSALVFTLINAVKELDARVKALEAKVGP